MYASIIWHIFGVRKSCVGPRTYHVLLPDIEFRNEDRAYLSAQLYTEDSWIWNTTTTCTTYLENATGFEFRPFVTTKTKIRLIVNCVTRDSVHFRQGSNFITSFFSGSAMALPNLVQSLFNKWLCNIWAPVYTVKKSQILSAFVLEIPVEMTTKYQFPAISNFAYHQSFNC